ncbi:hypothetical protein CYMTET_41510 [Cymbomonas tetramitiformis]|uniref:Uncharacterized protein n=1 Tax=Cymbomonas tetramitiformis TaxID=36881 RepID=A0AAE0F3J4_9CHLO|nr:hypothetical protein CYMTET_41510 [Cymbomonas tetramitiformis]
MIAAAAEDESEWKDGAKVKRKAVCWKYFMCRYSETQPVKIEDVYCKIRGPESTIALSGNTSNMRSDLAHVRKDVLCEMLSSAAGGGAGGGDGNGGPGSCTGSGSNP